MARHLASHRLVWTNTELQPPLAWPRSRTRTGTTPSIRFLSLPNNISNS